MNDLHMGIARELKVPVGRINALYKEARAEIEAGPRIKPGSARKHWKIRLLLLAKVKALKAQIAKEAEAAKTSVADPKKDTAKKESVA